MGDKPVILGCYLRDYPAEMPVPMDRLRYQWERIPGYLEAGLVDGYCILGAYLFDARGRMAPHEMLSTVDASGTRTEVDLADGQTAIVVRLPVRLQSSRPVNICVQECRDGVLDLSLNGQTEVILRAEGTRPVRVLSGPQGQALADGSLKLDLAGPVRLRLPVGGPVPVDRPRQGSPEDWRRPAPSQGCTEATSVLGDWAKPGEPAGPVGRQTMVSFVEVQLVLPEAGSPG